MRSCCVLFALLSLAAAAGAQSLDVPSGTYANDPTHSYVTFSYKHQGLSYPLLRAERVQGELELDADSVSSSQVAIAIATDSIRSNVDYFDEELASPKFFNAERFPYITFVSERIEWRADNTGTLHGQLTIRDRTEPISLEVRINGAKPHPFSGNPVVGASASGSLSRSAFGLDRFVPAVSDQVDVAIEMEFGLGSNDDARDAAALARGGAEQ